MTITIQVSETQIEILKHLEKGFTQKEISHAMGIESSRLKMNIYLMCEQWQCKNAVELVCTAIRKGVI